MQNVTILVTPDSAATTFTGPLDIFHQAGVLWNRICGMPPTPLFKVQIVTPTGKSFQSRTGLRVTPDGSIHQVKDTDLIILAALGELTQGMALHQASIAWLVRHHEAGACLASICTGTFLLAETGLLDGKSATTHWGFAPLFRQRYPQVNLKPQRLIVDHGDVLSAAGFSAGMDLALYLVEKYGGRETALSCAKAMLYDLHRHSQGSYAVFIAQKSHGDSAVATIQEYMEANYRRRMNTAHLAGQAGMSPRTLERRFKKATGDTPTLYLQRLRVEAAKRFLESSDHTFEQITYLVGYEECAFFRKLFTRHSGVSPKRYREKFNRGNCVSPS